MKEDEEMADHDPRVIALAKDHRTGPVWHGWWASGGDVAGFRGTLSISEAAEAALELGLDVAGPDLPRIAEDLLAYVRSVAKGVAETAAEVELALAILRDDEPSPGDPWSAREACDMTDALVDSGLLTPDEEPSPLEITPLGTAVMLVLEQAGKAVAR